MKVTLLLGEAATVHPDGTVSILRAGINCVWGQTLPVPLMGSLVVKIDAEASESGHPHTVEVRVIDADGKDIAPRIKGNFQVGTGGGSSTIILNFQMAFPKYGAYDFSTIINGMKYDSIGVKVTPPPQAKGDNK